MHCQTCMAMMFSDISEQEIMLIKEEKLSQRESSREQHQSQGERSADLLQVLNALAELMTGLTCYLSCSRWTLGNCYAVVCVDSLTFLSKVYSSVQKGTSPQVLCHYDLLQKPTQLNTWIFIWEEFSIKAQFYIKKTNPTKKLAKTYIRQNKGIISSASWPTRVCVSSLSAFPAHWTHCTEKGRDLSSCIRFFYFEFLHSFPLLYRQTDR